MAVEISRLEDRPRKPPAALCLQDLFSRANTVNDGESGGLILIRKQQIEDVNECLGTIREGTLHVR